MSRYSIQEVLNARGPPLLAGPEPFLQLVR